MEKTASADSFLAPFAAGLGGWPASRRALVAVSGGRDSVALLHGLLALGRRRLTVLHLDHRLRGRASTADAKFVARLARDLGLPLVSARADVRGYAKARGVSLEQAARELRHVFYAAAARRERCRNVFLAHHADDQVETCLFNFLRGSGPAGLAGMRPKSEIRIDRLALTLLRPMLALRRPQIESWLRARKIGWREDASNLSADHTRNRLRHRVLPILFEEFGPSFPEAILRSASLFAAEDDWMRLAAEKAAARSLELPVRELADHPLALRRRIVRGWLKESGVAETGFAETERVLSLLDVAGGPARVNLPGGLHARRREGRIFLERP